ncbi:hypothetical protein [Salinibacillus kushneri]|nr:hypothetical protein [Salinibacillus kushneri]
MEYFPGIIVVLFFCVIAIIVTRMFIKVSKKEQEKIDKQYGDQMKVNQSNQRDD